MKTSCLLFLLAINGAGAVAQIGIGTTTPNSMLDVRGSMSANFRGMSATGAVTATDHTVVYTGTNAGTLTLPTAVGCAGRMYWLKNANATSVPILTIATTSSQTIDGISSWTLDEPNEIACFVSNGTNWFVLNQNTAVAKSATNGSAWLQGGNRVTSAKSLGTISSFDLGFITSNIERMRISSQSGTQGYLGLGLTTPTGRLHVVNNSYTESGDDYIFDDYGSGTTQGIYLTKSRGTVGSPADLVLNDQIGHLRFVPRYNGTIGTVPGSSMEAYYKGNGTTSLTDLRFTTSNLERMRINENGNVGIGATTFNATQPEKLLVDAGTTTSFNVISGKGSINNYLQLNIQNKLDGDNASSDIVASANNATESAYFIDMGINSSAYAVSATNILSGPNTAYLYATGTNFAIGNGSSGKDLLFFTNGFNTTDEKMRILAAGNVCIGCATVANSLDKLTVAGNVVPSADNLYSLGKTGQRWSVVYAANGVVQTSDARLKTNIQPLKYGLSEIMKMRPVRYNWKTDPSGKSIVGLIAQEVQQIIPEVVVGDASKETLGMNYSELIPALIHAIQEQEVQINAIEQHIAEIKAKKTVK